MYAIALLLTIAVSTQTPPPDVPEPLKRGEMTYAFKLGEDNWVFGRFTDGEVNVNQGTGYFEIDEPMSELSGKRNFTFENYTPESEYGNETERERRWKNAVAKWRTENGYVQVDFANGSKGWVTQEELDWSIRAREAARSVIEKRQLDETLILDAPAATQVETEERNPPGFLQLWGPQAAVGALGLFLMGVAARVWVFNGDIGWQKIE